MAMVPETLGVVTVTSANQAYPLSETPKLAVSISIQANYNNIGRIAIGDSTVTPTTGHLLDKGEAAVIELPPDTRMAADFAVDKFYITSASSGDSVRVTVLKRE